ALAAVADGSTFGVVVAGYVPPQAKAPARASDASRRAAVEWLGKLETQPLAPAARVLASLLVTEADDLAYADTVLFVSASTRPAGKEVADLLVAKIGEMHGPLVHCVGVGDSYDAYLLACVALQTGGSFTAGETRLHAKVPAPGSDRWTAGSVRVAAYRALRSREGERDALTALASIGEEAYPLLPMLADCLGTDRSDDVRAEALAVLAAMGPLARELLPRIEKLAGDGSGVVADAARAALDKVSLR
ncbi:MAG: hypothetical protein L6Q95_09995, partial [Planctomycetes bacterium]|nr:hypothetical protein [Planctomycetota bacterium]